MSKGDVHDLAKRLLALEAAFAKGNPGDISVAQLHVEEWYTVQGRPVPPGITDPPPPPPRSQLTQQDSFDEPPARQSWQFPVEGFFATLIGIAMFGVAIVALAAAQEGIQKLTHWGDFASMMASLGTLIFPPGLVALSFYGMIEGWHWHWYWAVLFFAWPMIIGVLLFAGVITVGAADAAASGIRNARARSAANAAAARRANLLNDLAQLTDEEIEAVRRMRSGEQDRF